VGTLQTGGEGVKRTKQKDWGWPGKELRVAGGQGYIEEKRKAPEGGSPPRERSMSGKLIENRGTFGGLKGGRNHTRQVLGRSPHGEENEKFPP